MKICKKVILAIMCLMVGFSAWAAYDVNSADEARVGTLEDLVVALDDDKVLKIILTNTIKLANGTFYLSSDRTSLRKIIQVEKPFLPENGKVVYSKTRGFINGKKFNDIMDVWLFLYDGEVSLEKATTDEVAEVRWMTREQIAEIYASGGLVPTLEYFFTEVDR
jgi:hypothetical protein